MLEENHYYPFGLTMAGISDKALKLQYPQNKYKYNGIEQNNDFDLNIYDAFYRNLDPQIGRFWQVDPVTTYDESVYASMQDNPISKYDWLGNYFTFANMDSENRFNKLKQKNNELITGYLKELLSLDLKSTDKAVKKKVSQLTNLIKMHGELNSQWKEMSASGVEFHISDEKPKNSNAGGLTSFSSSENRVNIQVGRDDKWDGLDVMAHEIRHGYGYLSGEVMEGSMLWDMTDEVVAYNAGYLFLDRGTANLVAEGYYDVNWFKRTQLNTHGNLYKHLTGKEESLTVNTPAATVMKYYNNERISFLLNSNQNNANLTMKQAMDILNGMSKQSPPEFRYGELLKK